MGANTHDQFIFSQFFSPFADQGIGKAAWSTIETNEPLIRLILNRIKADDQKKTRIWIAFFFTGIIPRRTLLVWLKHGRVPTVVRPIFVAMMIGHVKTIQKLMLACFRSNYRSIWRTFNEMNHNGKFMLFSSNAGAFQVPHAQSSIPGWQDM